MKHDTSTNPSIANSPISNLPIANQPMQPWPSLAQYGTTLPLKGGDLFYFDSEAGRVETDAVPPQAAAQPLIVLIHGLGDEADSWRHLIPPLSAAGFRVIAPDLPGFGRSNGRGPGGKVSHNTAVPWKRKAGINEHTRALIALMEKAGASARNPAVLIGSSMGAMLTQIIAGKRPDLVRAIILVDGCHPSSGKPDPKYLKTALPISGPKWYRAFRSHHAALWHSLYGYYRDLETMSEADKNFLRKRVIERVESASQERAYFSSLRSLIGFYIFGNSAFARRMKTYTGKILLLWGADDRIMPVETTSRFRSLHPAADIQIIPGAGHLPHQEAPEETAAAIVKWLAGC